MFEDNWDNVQFLVGDKQVYNNTLFPYDLKICEFLNSFSSELSKKKYNKYPDLKSLSFWCRKKNIEKLKLSFKHDNVKKGKGLIFHITPSNVPTNFAYSLIFGLITGNSNIIKVPSKDFIQISIICNVIKKLLKIKKFHKVRNLIKILKYKENDTLTKYLSEVCDIRIIWGGSKSIQAIRQFPLQDRSFEITFADRNSLCIINSDEIKKLKKFDLNLLVKNFYNDTYLFDQNACSSPHLIIWTGNSVKLSRKKFWVALNDLLKKNYIIPDKASYDKFNQFCVDTAKLKNIKNHERYGNYIYTIFLNKIDKSIENFKGKWGYFYEYETKNFNNLQNVIGKKYQTLTYYGVKKDFLSSIFKNDLKGIDRIVPIGQALDISLNWDGFDINNLLTRVVEIK